MKNILLFLLLFSISEIFSQVPYFERSFEPQVNSNLSGIVHDSSGYFYAIGSSSNISALTSQGVFMKLDREGNFIFQNNHPSPEVTFLNDLIIDKEGDFFVCGYSPGCDVGDIVGVIGKYNSNGDSIWTRFIRFPLGGSSVDNNLKRIIVLDNGTLVSAADSTLYFYNGQGDSLSARVVNFEIKSIASGLNDKIICGNSAGILIMDSIGTQLASYSFPFTVSHLSFLSDSTYIVGSANTLNILDTSFSILHQTDLSNMNLSANKLIIEEGKIWISSLRGSDYAAFDFNLQLTDSFRTQAADVIVNSFSVNDSTIMVAGEELRYNKSSYLKAYSSTGNYNYYPVDLALINIQFDTIIVDQPSPLPSGVYRLSFVSRITVENTGSDTIRSFYIHAQSMLPGPCGRPAYSLLKENLNLLPGHTYTFSLDTLSEFGVVLSSFPYHYQFCPWISCPNFKVDKDHSNDYLCGTMLVEDPNAIDELDEFPKVNIYPNPSGSLFTIEFPDHFTHRSSFALYDSYGKKHLYGPLTGKINQINVSDFSSGIYFIKIVSKNKTSTRRFVIL